MATLIKKAILKKVDKMKSNFSRIVLGIIAIIIIYDVLIVIIRNIETNIDCRAYDASSISKLEECIETVNSRYPLIP